MPTDWYNCWPGGQCFDTGTNIAIGLTIALCAALIGAAIAIAFGRRR
jgi:hypothetical protein